VKTVFFDLDGTLTDPRDGILRCIEHGFEAIGRAAPPHSVLLGWIGPSLRRTLVDFFGDEALSDRALAAYRERYLSVGFSEARLYDGVVEMLDAIRSAGMRTFVVTAKPQPFARKVVEHFGLADRFESVFGPGLDGSNEDKRELLRIVLQQTAIDASSSFMVGDREHDMHAAVANAVIGIGATWGYGSKEELVQAKARILCARPRDVLPAIETYR